MRLHSLTVTGFGPYATTQRVDFDALSVDGLFLLHGDTGAGKTTLLDAVAFALYGSVPGARNSAKRLRSDAAADETPTEVEVEFTVQGNRLRIMRSPEYERQKLRGGGTTKQPAKARLIWVSNPELEPSTRIDEVSRTVQGLLGMTADQFFQVVLLPQGEFAKFLRADTTEREKLLEKLFDTERFNNIEQWFRDERAAQGRELETLRGDVDKVQARIAQVLGAEVPAEFDEDWLNDTVKTLLDEEKAFISAEAVHRSVQQAAADKLAVAQLRLERLTKVEEATARQQDILAHEPEIQAYSKELELAQRANVVQSALTAFDGLRARETTAAARVESLRADFSGDVPADPEREISQLQELVGQLESAWEVQRQFDADQQQLVELRNRLTSLQRQEEELPEQVDVLTRTVQFGKWEVANQARVRAEDELRKAVDKHQIATDLVQGLREKRLSGMAGELALSLLAGEPCVVCGATEHPRPASVTEIVAPEEEERAQLAQDKAASVREKAAGKHASALANAEELCAVVGDFVPAAPGTEQELAVKTAQLATARVDYAGVQAKIDTIETTNIGRAEMLAKYGDVSVRRVEVRVRLTEVKALWQAQQELAQTTVKAAEQEISVRESLQESGFSDAMSVKDATRSTAHLQRLVTRIHKHQTDSAAVEQILSDPAYQLMIGSVREELLEVAANAELELGGVRELVEQAVSARAAAHLQVVQFEQLSAQATTLLRKLVPVAEKTATLVALADLINGRGQNARKMSLRSYVLSARLTDIANAASARLRTMSQGRYHLVRSDGPERSGMRTGLGLDVHDEYTGRIRPAKTLSGGESFLASLSLALGLVDVVSAESGGIQLDTLFIDEGFGSLDSSTLEEVLGVLDELRAGGRVVGVVSHVEELRHRIPTRLRVSKSPAGSSVSQI